jgi:predicted RNA-binding Zn-ribbon protein involved in translation (DUF1610 family)
MAGEVAHHFRCPGCGYDLYRTPLDGNCPECGKSVPRRKALAKAKNPRRVNSWYRSHIRQLERTLWWMVPICIVLIAVAVASFWFHYPRFWRWVVRISAGSSVVSVLGIWLDIKTSKEKMVPEEETSARDPNATDL